MTTNSASRYAPSLSVVAVRFSLREARYSSISLSFMGDLPELISSTLAGVVLTA